MSVQDDAQKVRETLTTRSLGRAALWAALAGAAAVALYPAAWLPYHTGLDIRSTAPPYSALEQTALRRSGVRIDQRRTAAGSWRLEARAPSAEQAEGALAEAAVRGLARGTGAIPSAAPDEVGPAFSPALTSNAQTGAWLLAEAGALEGAVDRMGPTPPVTLSAPSTAQDRLQGSLALLDDEHASAVRERDPGRLAHVVRVLPATETAWAREVAHRAGEVGSDAVDAERALLRVRWLQRAGLDRRAASVLIDGRPADERARVEAAAASFERDLVAGLPGRAELERDATVSTWIIPARRPVAPRVAAGLIVAGITLVLIRALGYRRAPAPADGPREHRAALEDFAIHWVSARSARASASAALGLAARGLERGERVLLVDAGGRTRLHQVLRREDRWGLAECVRDRLPVLGVVQDGGIAGLFLLARGEGRAVPGWREVARVVGAARTHFDRTIICVESLQLRDAGRLLSTDGFGWWWGRAGGNGARPDWLVETMDNSCNDIEVPATIDLSLDLLGEAARRARLAAAPLPVDEATPVPAVLLPEPALDCDLQVGERLRFLAWVRQLHEELPSATSDRQPAEEDAVISR